jgi:hypothetical protein
MVRNFRNLEFVTPQNGAISQSWEFPCEIGTQLSTPALPKPPAFAWQSRATNARLN